MNKDQYAHDRNYSDVWKEQDYLLHQEISRPALTVHGLNDNVDSTLNLCMMPSRKQDKMSSSIFTKSHVYPAAMSLRGYGITANGQDFYDLAIPGDPSTVVVTVESLPAVLAPKTTMISKWLL